MELIGNIGLTDIYSEATAIALGSKNVIFTLEFEDMKLYVGMGYRATAMQVLQNIYNSQDPKARFYNAALLYAFTTQSTAYLTIETVHTEPNVPLSNLIQEKYDTIELYQSYIPYGYNNIFTLSNLRESNREKKAAEALCNKIGSPYIYLFKTPTMTGSKPLEEWRSVEELPRLNAESNNLYTPEAFELDLLKLRYYYNIELPEPTREISTRSANGVFKLVHIWPCTKAAADYYNVNPAQIANCCRNGRITCAGGFWRNANATHISI